MLGNLQLER